MEPWVKELLDVKENTSLTINKRADEILKILMRCKLAYKQTLLPNMLLVHQDNRSGAKLNSFDVHAKGKTMADIGFSYSKLGQSIAMELPADPSARAHVIKCNEKLVSLSQGMLPAVNGNERWSTISTSHTTSFLKAVEQQCKTPENDLSAGGCLSFDLLSSKGDDLKAMICTGWEWTCICAEVEKQCPSLPAFLQQALNSTWLKINFFVFLEIVGLQNQLTKVIIS